MRMELEGHEIGEEWRARALLGGGFGVLGCGLRSWRDMLSNSGLILGRIFFESQSTGNELLALNVYYGVKMYGNRRL
jgi:hypothetical protein